MTRRSFLTAAGATVAAQALQSVSTLAAQASVQAKPLKLKITGLKTFVVNVGGSNWVFCKVYTDQGLVGLAGVYSELGRMQPGNPERCFLNTRIAGSGARRACITP